MKNKRLFYGIVLVILVIITVVALLVVSNKSKKEIDSFEDCVDAGYPVLQTYPVQCKTPDGKTFTESSGGVLEP